MVWEIRVRKKLSFGCERIISSDQSVCWVMRDKIQLFHYCCGKIDFRLEQEWVKVFKCWRRLWPNQICVEKARWWWEWYQWSRQSARRWLSLSSSPSFSFLSLLRSHRLLSLPLLSCEYRTLTFVVNFVDSVEFPQTLVSMVLLKCVEAELRRIYGVWQGSSNGDLAIGGDKDIFPVHTQIQIFLHSIMAL